MKKKILILLLVLALVFPVTGCFEKATVESLLKDAAEKLEKTESYEFTGELDIDVSIEIQTMSVGVLAEGKADVSVTEDATHIKGSGSVKAMDENEDAEFEMYMMEGKDEITVYADMGEGWTKSVTEDEDEVDDVLMVMEAVKIHNLIDILSDHDDDLELADDTEKVGKNKAYVIEGTVSGEYLEDLLKSIDVDEIQDEVDSMLEETDVDFSDYEVEIRLLIDTKTKLPVSLELDFADAVTKIVEEVMETMMGFQSMYDDEMDYEDYDEDDEDDEDPADEISVKVKTCRIELEFASFNEVDEIEVPKKVRDSAKENENGLLDGDMIDDVINEIDM